MRPVLALLNVTVESSANKLERVDKWHFLSNL
ncbi:unnamed protein product [Plutella xylostella]|uniref:(diamondback moth) hypothetical protein n=1 Tax=Plutella xylostella TaxID=51655 RepID=A0A8S4FV12_PLUXY|nr:unnamed protein product [Plutella xylostella]